MMLSRRWPSATGPALLSNTRQPRPSGPRCATISICAAIRSESPSENQMPHMLRRLPDAQLAIAQAPPCKQRPSASIRAPSTARRAARSALRLKRSMRSGSSELIAAAIASGSTVGIVTPKSYCLY